MSTKWSIVLMYSDPNSIAPAMKQRMTSLPVIDCAWGGNWNAIAKGPATNFLEFKTKNSIQLVVSMPGTPWDGTAVGISTKEFASEGETRAWIEDPNNVDVNMAQMIFVCQSTAAEPLMSRRAPSEDGNNLPGKSAQPAKTTNTSDGKRRAGRGTRG